MKITKGLIACAGWSTRFLPTVKTYAKQLVPVLDKPQIQWVLEEFAAAGITNIAIVYRPGETSLLRHFKKNPELRAFLAQTNKTSLMTSHDQLLAKIKLTFIPQLRRFGYGNGIPVLAARSFIANQPFVFAWGDDLTIENQPGAFLTNMIKTFHQYQPAVVGSAQKVPRREISRYGSYTFKSDPQYPNRVSSIIEKPRPNTAPSLFAQGARFILTPKIIPILQHQKTQKGELWLTDAINALAKKDIVLVSKYQDNNALWTVCGDPIRWLKSNLILACRRPDFKKEIKTFLKNL